MDITIDKRERILATASRLIVKNGLQSSRSAIAEEAGVATGSLYNYFDSKEALVRGVYGRVTEQMTELVTVETAPEMPHDVRVQRYISQYLEFIREDPLRAQLFDYLDNTPFITLSDAKVTSHIRACEERLNGSGRLLVRKSGTEPVIRIMGDDQTTQ